VDDLEKYETLTDGLANIINILASGVNEISSGNLAHRIDYNGGDEFDYLVLEANVQ
jgi:methyl-accepting chemotaxis protein